MIEIINIILVFYLIAQILINKAFALAVFLVPVEANFTVDRCAGTFTVHGVPEEVVWTLAGAADALADFFVENFVTFALDWGAFALAYLGIKVLSFCTRSQGVAAFTTAVLSIPEEFRRAVVGSFGLCADAATVSCVKVM